MLRWGVVFLILAVVAALFALGGLAATQAGIARLLFYLFVLGFLATSILGLASGRTPLL